MNFLTIANDWNICELDDVGQNGDRRTPLIDRKRTLIFDNRLMSFSEKIYPSTAAIDPTDQSMCANDICFNDTGGYIRNDTEVAQKS
jgi:hypothetical protein